MTDFRPSEDQLALTDVASKVAREVYGPLADTWESSHTPLPDTEVKRLADLGFLGICLPERVGGGGAPLMDALVVIEELAKVCRPAAFQVFEANVGPARVIEFFGTDQQKSRFLPPVVTGELTMAIAISEPDAGSAATDMRTRGRIEGDSVVVTGGKRWISNGGHADHYLVYCRLSDDPGSRGIGAVVVPADAAGVSFGAREQLMGWRGIPSADVYLDDVRLPIENVIIGPGGFKKLFGVFSIERLGNATMSLALGQAALDRAVAYVSERKQFGRPILEFQNVQQTIAEMKIQVDAARMLIRRAAVNAGHDLPNTLEVSVAKCYANEMAKRVTDLAMQMHGGNGYTVEYGVERLHRDAHGWAIAGGTPAIQRVRIASELFNRSFDQRPRSAS
jgi:alkylation response protein AidB-like acyl-CoA dehydrogenase